MVEENRTKIKRDNKKTLTSVVGAAVLLALAVWMVTARSRTPFMIYAFAGMLLLPISFLIYRAIGRTGIGECPGCDMYLLGVSPTTNEGLLCGSCGRYVEGKHGELWMTPDDRVATFPMFRSEVPQEIVWPEGCCVCGQTPTRVIAAKLIEQGSASVAPDLAVRVASLGTVKLMQNQTYRVDVPHCDKHDDGAVLESAIDSDMLNPAISFRSHGYLRRFCELNNTPARH